MQTDIEIAQAAKLKPIADVAKTLNIRSEDLIAYGQTIAKLSVNCLNKLKKNTNGKLDGKLILVTAISPTPAGEGKTTTTIGLADALCKIGKKAIVCIREPSLGPVFGMKGGATGGGFAQVVPMENINLHFTGDFHAITAANNLLAALIDNHIHHGNALQIDVHRISWKPCLDMNDRALRHITLHHQYGDKTSGFDITVASEVMAIFCLAENLDDLKTRLANIQVAVNMAGSPVLAGDLHAQGAMTALLKDAFQPNLVQTLEHTPALIHGGPFANIAHGCNSVIATKTALKLADYVVTEAGFGADLGAEKFFDIKCRAAKLQPDAVLIVATIRALKYHGGAELSELSHSNLNHENIKYLLNGISNLKKHLKNLHQQFGMQAIVAINHFLHDTQAEIDALTHAVEALGFKAVVCKHWAQGGAGATDLAHEVVALIDR
ncbi:MAG: formate--tetrahydrofolate ligase, partial [Bdellovibrio sp.]|nr:formate--tetrahydrofolate ligase [Methylotenera sp.]